ncbi:MAG: class I SAM-dependent methyltransferase [Ekhidna sp.]
MLEVRSEEQEIMDDLTISGPVVAQTLRELNTINRWLGGNQISVGAYKRLASKNEQKISVADLGCGGGDLMKEMARWSRKKGVNAQFTGFDANPHIVAYARENTSDFSEIAYEAEDILSSKFRARSFDLIHCCLFLHHFTEAQLVRLFRQFKEQTRIGVIVNDLHRHPLAYWSIGLLTWIFSKSEMVRNDASVSVARGFKRKELEGMLKEAGIENYQLKWKWAFRWELVF